MGEQILVPERALRAVLEYLWTDERDDLDPDDPPDNHIFHSLRELRDAYVRAGKEPPV
jgi:hypothetical protein